MVTVTVDEIQQDLAACLKRVRPGETLLIVDADQPVAEMTPLTGAGLKLRPYALAAGEFVVRDDFDAPLPAEMIEQFEGR
jgi:antitoxin (DNA-binding transcriptional repressor) of toxin-antitoxin stability system